MKTIKTPVIFTIGHSTHSLAVFLDMLQSFEVKFLADIRSLPGSCRYPQFNKDSLELSLQENGIQYEHLSGLGGRRKAKKDSKNIRWNNASFRGYADYMETGNFVHAVTTLEQIAHQQTTAYMCSEAVWWRCHRSMVSDYLKAAGWEVLHIMAPGKAKEHSYTAPAIIEDGLVSYSEEN